MGGIGGRTPTPRTTVIRFWLYLSCQVCVWSCAHRHALTLLVPFDGLLERSTGLFPSAVLIAFLFNTITTRASLIAELVYFFFFLISLYYFFFPLADRYGFREVTKSGVVIRMAGSLRFLKKGRASFFERDK